MMIIMALCVFGVVLPLGGVNPELALPSYVLAAALAVLCAGWVLFSKQASYVRSPIHLPVGLFCLYAFGRYFFSPVEYDARVELLQVGVCLCVYVVSATYFHHPRDRVLFIAVLCTLGLAESALGFWQVGRGAEMVNIWIWERPAYPGRASGTYIYPNQFAFLLELILGMVAARIVLVRREGASTERSMIAKVFLIYVALMLIAGILASRSRAGWIVMVVSFVALLVLGDWRSDWRTMATSRGLVVTAVLLVLSALLILNFKPVRERLLFTLKSDARGAVTLNDWSLGGRVLIWQGTAKMVRDNPVFGTGVGSFQWSFQRYKDPALLSRPEHTHNDYLNLAADYGLFGVILAIWALAGFWRQAWKVSRPGHPPEAQAFAVGAMVSIAALLIHALFDFPLHLPANTLLVSVLLGMVAGMEDQPGQYRRRPMGGPLRGTVAAGLLLLAGAGLYHAIPTAKAFRYTDLGNQLRKDLEYESALNYYAAAMELDPKFPEPPARIGDIHRTLARWRLGPGKEEERRELARKAVAAYDRSLAQNPYQSFVWADRGRVSDLAGDYAEAERSFQKAIEVYPVDGSAYFAFGAFYRDHGQQEKALEMFRVANDKLYDPAAGLNVYEITNAPKAKVP
jgi:O-antigen ligase